MSSVFFHIDLQIIMLYVGEQEVQAENHVKLTLLLIFFAHYFCLVSIPHNGMLELVL